MRILKYLVFLAILLFGAGLVFIATSDSSYTITRTKFIKSPRNTVFKFVEDYSLWKIWFLGDDPTMKFTMKNSADSKPGFKWNGEAGNGEIFTDAIIGSDSIIQNIVLNEVPAKGYWTFKDSSNGTLVKWRIVGTLSFKDKYSAALQGGAEHLVDRMYERSISVLQKTVSDEVRKYKIRIEGLSEVPAKYYLYQKITSKESDLNRNIRIMMTRLEYFADKNKITVAGDPFVVYNHEDRAKKLATISVCIPVTEEIFLVEPSDVFFHKLPGYKSVKTTVEGDYSHLAEARAASLKYIEKYNYKVDFQTSRAEFYRNRSSSEKLPSKWKTEIHTPIGVNVAPEAKVTQPARAIRPQPTVSTPTNDEFDL